MISKDKYSN